MRHKVVLWKQVTLLPYMQVQVKVANKKFGLIHMKHNNFLLKESRVHPADRNYKLVANKPFKISSANFSSVEKHCSIGQTKTGVADLSFVAPDEELTNSTPTDQESLLSRAVRIEHGPGSRQREPRVGTFENKPTTLQDWQSLVNLSLLENKTLRKEIMEMVSKHKEL